LQGYPCPDSRLGKVKVKLYIIFMKSVPYFSILIGHNIRYMKILRKLRIDIALIETEKDSMVTH